MTHLNRRRLSVWACVCVCILGDMVDRRREGAESWVSEVRL